MAYFAVQYVYSNDAELVARVRPDHRSYLRTLVEAGTLKASGPYVGVQRDSALLVFSADDADQVRALIAQDPMSLNNVLESFTVTQWNPLLGVFAS
ncbi:YciI family protein [Brooklawnia sp.]|uniref:YciI family protein n=1 Tax=Brooklawnia sp. TaxID=2699740 RepID=UPI00311E81E3